MPIYEFKCKSCDTRFEKLCSLGETGVTCPQCGSSELKKLMSGFFSNSKGSDSFSSASEGGGGCAGCHSHNCGSCHS